MNTKARRSLQSMKPHVKHEKEKLGMQSSWTMDAKKPCTNKRDSIREKKMALQQDVDKLKKRLRHEENVHRALERAFTRPWGVRPRLPPYLPAHTLELLAEVAVLEEEVGRLEEKVVHFRQGLYQEAVYSCSKKNMDNSPDLSEPTQIKDMKPKQLSKSSLHIEATFAAIIWKILDERRGKENQNYSKSKRQSNQEEISAPDNSANKISESILKCLMNIFMRMSSKKNRSTSEALNSLPVLNSSESLEYMEFNDPYNTCLKFGKRDIGPYKHAVCIEAALINPNQTTISVFQVQRLKVLLQRLAKVELKGLSHQEKLAFWINIYNSCMMNAFIEHGIPESPEMVVELMQKATVNVGGHVLNAITIEHFILRLPYHSKHVRKLQTFLKGTKYAEMMTRSVFGLELPEPLVTFALSCGSWSSPAVRVYTASHVENELETAKKEYLQAAIGISSSKKVISVPKLLDWYLLDFAKDSESLLDWICLQLPSEIGIEAMKCIERRRDESLQITPYDFSSRYLLHA